MFKRIATWWSAYWKRRVEEDEMLERRKARIYAEEIVKLLLRYSVPGGHA